MTLHEVAARELSLFQPASTEGVNATNNSLGEEPLGSLVYEQFACLEPIERLRILKACLLTGTRDESIALLRRAETEDQLFSVRFFAALYLCRLNMATTDEIGPLLLALDGSAIECADVICATLFFEACLCMARRGDPVAETMINRALNVPESFSGPRQQIFSYFSERVRRGDNLTKPAAKE